MIPPPPSEAGITRELPCPLAVYVGFWGFELRSSHLFRNDLQLSHRPSSWILLFSFEIVKPQILAYYTGGCICLAVITQALKCETAGNKPALLPENLEVAKVKRA